nr:AAA family ATPase [Actinomycetota bacterium]
MLICPACGTSNPPAFSYCGHCATPLAGQACSACGTVNSADSLFCGHCATPLSMSSVGPIAVGPIAVAPALQERKLATVLFADVVGFTSLSEKTDPEVVARLVDSAFRRMAEVVTDHGGTVDKYMGDSIMAVFGVPVAHDEDAERAVAAGLAMRELGGDLAFSIGINSGEVMATTMGGAGDVTVIGDTVNVAARLEKAAGAGEVLCGPLTADLAGRRIVFRERQPVVLKGKREPVGVWQAVALRPDDHGGDPDGPPLVGRDDELAFLVAQWRRVRRDGKAQVFVICGDAGAGKSRLVDELAARVGADGLVIRSTYPAYGPMGGGQVPMDIYRQLGSLGDSDVDARMRSLAGDLDPSLKAIDPGAIQQEQLWAIGRLFKEKASDRPLLVAVEGLHRSGERSLELLSSLTSRIDDIPMLLVLTGRSEPHDWLTWFPTATTLRLLPLSRADAALLAGALVADAPLAADAADFLVERANGNPLYLRELVAAARARGSLVLDGGTYHLVAHGAIPASLQALLAARLDALEPGQKLVLQLVSVMGVAATADQVAAVGADDPVPALRALADAGLLRRGRDGGGYDVEDPLLREVAYETLPRTVRGHMHRRAAVVAELVEERARHLERATEYLPDDTALALDAAEALADAGAAFAAASRISDAIRALERAVALGLQGPAALLQLAQLQATQGRHDAALSTLAQIPDDPVDPGLAVERDHAAAAVQIFPAPAEALSGLRSVAPRWRALGNTVKEGWAHANAGVALFNLSRMGESAAEMEVALDLFGRAGDRAGLVSTQSFACLVMPADSRVPGWLADSLDFAHEAGDRSRQ